MSLIYCRNCGQQIHVEALACPHCGAPQIKYTRKTADDSPALSIISCVFGVLTLLGALSLDTPSSKDEIVGCITLFIVATVCGAVSLYHRKPYQSTAVIGVVTASIGLATLIGL